jgi:hypothetical protein
MRCMTPGSRPFVAELAATSRGIRAAAFDPFGDDESAPKESVRTAAADSQYQPDALDGSTPYSRSRDEVSRETSIPASPPESAAPCAKDRGTETFSG